MSLTNILTVACTLAVGGVVGHTIYNTPEMKTADDTLVAYIGAPADPVSPAASDVPARDIVAELLAPTVVVARERTPVEFGAVHFGNRAVSETDVAEAKRLWQERLDNAMAINRAAAAAPSPVVDRTPTKPKRSRYRPSGRGEDTRRTMFERSRRVRRPKDRSYGLPRKKRTSRRIRRTR